MAASLRCAGVRGHHPMRSGCNNNQWMMAGVGQVGGANTPPMLRPVGAAVMDTGPGTGRMFYKPRLSVYTLTH